MSTPHEEGVGLPKDKDFDEVADSLLATRHAAYLFDHIASASYYGMKFRHLLATNKEAREAAEVLVKKLIEGSISSSMLPDEAPKAGK